MIVKSPISTSSISQIGAKAKNLFVLKELGILVPDFAVIPQNILLDQLTNSNNEAETKDSFEDLSVPKEIISELSDFFGPDFKTKTYSVRSSAIDEDGENFSFAGQYVTHLHVSFEEIEKAILSIWKSTVSERVLTYRKQNNLPLVFGIGVVVQEMIEPEISGVAFGIDPVNNDPNTKVISSVYGLGEGIVSGELDADTFKVRPGGIEERIVTKKRKFVRADSGNGINQIDVSEHLHNCASLSKIQINEIADILDKLKTSLGKPQDIEFAYFNERLFLLQTRPVTALAKTELGEYIVWDNSNIIESYPGITTPLTFTFIIKMYEMVYRQFSGLLGVKESEINRNSEVFANTLGLVRGRVYYNLLSWYKMLAMVPGYSVNAQYMETMMGVKERFELKEDFKMSRGKAKFRILLMVLNMFILQFRLPRERKKFKKYLNAVMEEYHSINFDILTSGKIIEHYLHFERSLLLKWKAPLINDFFAMIWFGLLQKKIHQLFPDEPNMHNDLLCGSEDIISVEPIHRSLKIAKMVSEDELIKQIFIDHSPEEIWIKLKEEKFSSIRRAIDEYIDLFGERCVGELKLETISYSQNPVLYVKLIKSYVMQNITAFRTDKHIEEDVRLKAEKRVDQALKGKFFKRMIFKLTLKKAREHVSNRENLRFERTRGFGMVRKMFSALGQKLAELKHIENPRDIFYLELNEIIAMKDGDLPFDLKEKINIRKREFQKFKEQPEPEERFFTYGNNFSDDYIYSKDKILKTEGDLKGIGCCPGIVQGKVRVVKDPGELESLEGDILVTSNTDPGWVTLFPSAGAIIVERGSLLSHSAIVSREMGIPCIVSVTGLLRTLKTGDEIIMNGSTGLIQLIRH